MLKEKPASTFDPEDVDRLGQIAQLMIPASGSSPGAADPTILERTLKHLVGSYSLVRSALEMLEAMAEEQFGSSFRTLTESQQRELCPSHLDPQFRAQFELVVASTYFSDPRVMTELGMPPRPPYPLGYELPETDWSLLEPVKERGPIYRSVD